MTDNPEAKKAIKEAQTKFEKFMTQNKELETKGQDLKKLIKEAKSLDLSDLDV